MNGGANARPVSGEVGYSSASGVNPLVWAANRLLDMIAQIRGIHQLQDPAALRKQLVTEIQNFEQRAQSVGVSREDLIGARYCLCTVLDEVAALTPWGSNNVWAKQSLLVSFHNETWGGEKYYQLLARLAQNPERHKDLIELLYYCNALGFEGRFRVENDGYTQLEMLKRRIATILGNVRGGYENRLSLHWQGVSSTPPVWRMIPPWVVAMLCGLIGLGIFAWLLFSLGSRTDVTFGKLASLTVPKAVRQQVVPPPRPLCESLSRAINESRVTVKESDGRCVVILRGDGMFGSGSTDIRDEYQLVLGHVADALRSVGSGRVIVSGHTDNVPIRSLRYPSNQQLSEARAESVRALLESGLGPTTGISVIARGFGETRPVAQNNTPEGRAQNRRVEVSVVLAKQGDARPVNSSGSME